jgi:glycolate oxidase iron-sulfur subunit
MTRSTQAGSLEGCDWMSQYEALDPRRTSLPTRAFDDHRPPSAEIIADCVHCGFCLPTCPTYLLWSEEMDSPRGRIVLMKSALEGEIPLSETTVRHFDQCLGCMACVTACPSGVRYDRLIESTRAQVERRHPRTRRDRLVRSLIFALFPHPQRLRALSPAIWLYQKVGVARLMRVLVDEYPTRWRASWT